MYCKTDYHNSKVKEKHGQLPWWYIRLQISADDFDGVEVILNGYK